MAFPSRCAALTETIYFFLASISGNPYISRMLSRPFNNQYIYTCYTFLYVVFIGFGDTGRLFANKKHILKCILVNENCCICFEFNKTSFLMILSTIRYLWYSERLSAEPAITWNNEMITKVFDAIWRHWATVYYMNNEMLNTTHISQRWMQITQG